MQIILIAIAIMLAGGLLSLLAHKNSRLSDALGAGAAIAGGLIGIVPASFGLLSVGPEKTFSHSWAVPFGSFSIGLDAVSSIFLIPIFILTLLAAIYGFSYMRMHRDEGGRGSGWFYFCVLSASMAMVVVARNGILFLFAWEIMAISSFFLVTYNDKKESVRDAGWLYFVATHIGTGFILILFAFMAKETGTFDFAGWKNFPVASHHIAGVLFVLALVGFGTKAGIVPLHVWLPKAHPAAPSHVSAVMSGVMIKTGIYGIIRMIEFLGPPPIWWGELMIGVGVVSGIVGVLYALAQHDMKSLLAYCSVENIGIIFMGFGLGLVGQSSGNSLVAVLGFGGALLHVVNHAVFKGLLFFGAGSVIARAGTGEMDRLGGIIKKMPLTGAAFATGAASISGLPPFNGFVSEFLIYAGAFACMGLFGGAPQSPVLAVVVILSLALIGSLAAACFSKIFGIVFLGEPRSKSAAKASEAPAAMIFSKVFLAIACIAIGLLSPLVLDLLAPVIGAVGALPIETVLAVIEKIRGPISYIAIISAGLIVLSLAILLLRMALLGRRVVARSLTWDCGFAAPSSTMQYTASSYSRPIVNLFRPLLFEKRSYLPPQGLFPDSSSYESHSSDIFGSGIFRPFFESVRRLFMKFRFLQHGDVNIYVLYIAIVLIILLVWKFGAL